MQGTRPCYRLHCGPHRGQGTQRVWGQAQPCGLLGEPTPALTPSWSLSLPQLPTVLGNPLHPCVSPRCGGVRADACPQHGCPPKCCAGWVTRPFAWQQPRPPRQPEPPRCRTSSTVGCGIAGWLLPTFLQPRSTNHVDVSTPLAWLPVVPGNGFGASRKFLQAPCWGRAGLCRALLQRGLSPLHVPPGALPRLLCSQRCWVQHTGRDYYLDTRQFGFRKPPSAIGIDPEILCQKQSTYKTEVTPLQSAPWPHVVATARGSGPPRPPAATLRSRGGCRGAGGRAARLLRPTYCCRRRTVRGVPSMGMM